MVIKKRVILILAFVLGISGTAYAAPDSQGPAVSTAELDAKLKQLQALIESQNARISDLENRIRQLEDSPGTDIVTGAELMPVNQVWADGKYRVTYDVQLLISDGSKVPYAERLTVWFTYSESSKQYSFTATYNGGDYPLTVTAKRLTPNPTVKDIRVSVLDYQETMLGINRTQYAYVLGVRLLMSDGTERLHQNLTYKETVEPKPQKTIFITHEGRTYSFTKTLF